MKYHYTVLPICLAALMVFHYFYTGITSWEQAFLLLIFGLAGYMLTYSTILIIKIVFPQKKTRLVHWEIEKQEVESKTRPLNVEMIEEDSKILKFERRK